MGQYLELQTCGCLRATVHRVRNTTAGERYSLPFFLTPDARAQMDVLACCKQPGKTYETIDVGNLYVRRVLAARTKHPTNSSFRDVPKKKWNYRMLLS